MPPFRGATDWREDSFSSIHSDISFWDDDEEKNEAYNNVHDESHDGTFSMSNDQTLTTSSVPRFPLFATRTKFLSDDDSLSHHDRETKEKSAPMAVSFSKTKPPSAGSIKSNSGKKEVRFEIEPNGKIKSTMHRYHTPSNTASSWLNTRELVEIRVDFCKMVDHYNSTHPEYKEAILAYYRLSAKPSREAAAVSRLFDKEIMEKRMQEIVENTETRGLITTLALEATRTLSKQHVQSVLEAQKDHIQDSDIDQEEYDLLLRNASRKFSRANKKVAIQLAKLDCFEALKEILSSGATR